VNVLLDTCALLALAQGNLRRQSSAALERAPEAHVSSVSAWEVAIKVAVGKLRLRESALEWFHGLCERYQLRELPLDARVACAAAALPPLHRDPFDRVLVALARAHTLTVLTSDDDIARYPDIKTLW
jgi:PIN domain nuclease of toxin-antitoxin system